MKDFPVEGVAMTILLVVSDLETSKKFYKDVLGAKVFREYGGDSVVFEFQDTWLLIVIGGEPTEGKPGIYFRPPKDLDHVSFQMTMRVPDCRASYEILKSRGAEFLTPPIKREGEIRCFFRDPDGHLLEISEST